MLSLGKSLLLPEVLHLLLEQQGKSGSQLNETMATIVGVTEKKKAKNDGDSASLANENNKNVPGITISGVRKSLVHFFIRRLLAYYAL